jgi:hypothetical protein
MIRVFPKRQGDNVFSRQCEVFVLHTHGAEPAESKAFEGLGPDQIRIGVSYNPKKDAALPPPGVGEPPTESILRSRQSLWVSTQKMDVLDDISPGQIVMLNGVTGRTWLANVDTPTPSWAKSYDAGAIEAVTGMTLQAMWTAASGMGTDFLFPNDLIFDESNQSSRYNRQRTHLISVHTMPRPDDEEGQTQRAARMARECGETTLITKNWSSKTWEIEEQPGRSRAMRANLVFAHMQWPPNTPFNAGEVDEILVGLSLYEEQLRDFGFGNNYDAWVALAPLIWSKLNFKAIGYIDTKGTESNFGGVQSDKKIDFALQFNGMGLIPDLESCYREVGVPVTSDFVLDMHQRQAWGGVGAAIATGGNMLENLAAVVPVTGSAADMNVAKVLAAMTGEDAPEYRALVNYTPTRAVMKGLATLNAEEGSALVAALQTNDTGEISGNKKLNKLYDSMATGNSTVHVVVFALCTKIIPKDVQARRNADLMAFMLGKAAAGAPAIENGSAATVEEVDDDDAAGEEEEEEEEEAPVKRKKPTGKKSKKGKPAQKRSRTEH